MLSPDACERRVYRLATLLTGSPVAAAGVITDVVGSRRDIREIDSAHLDRLTVLRCREIRPGRIVDAGLPEQTAAALAGLSAQQREAWIFHRVYELPGREIARAMDCSTTATRRHLDQADAAMNAAGPQPGAAVQTLRRYSMGLDVPAFHRQAMARRRRLRMATLIILLTLALAGLLLLARVLT